jgi:hypothetical protein
LESQVKKDKEEQPMKRHCNRPIKEKEGWSARLANDLRSLTLSIDGLVGQTDRPMVNHSIGRCKERRW